MNGVITIVSPPLGALLMSVMTMQAVLAIDLLVTAAIMPRCWRCSAHAAAPALANSGSADTARVLADVRNGLKYAVGWSGLFKLMVMASLINMLASPAFLLLPLMVTKITVRAQRKLPGWNPRWGWALWRAGCCWAYAWGGFKRKTATTLTGLIGMGVGITVLGLTETATPTCWQ